MVHLRPGRIWAPSELPRGVRPTRSHPPLFDALTATASDLQQQMTDGKLLSTDIVQEYIWRTQEFNGWLNAVWELAPSCMEQAEEADEKRKSGIAKGPLLGIPIWLKDNVGVHPSLGMGTTAGAVALLGSTPKASSPLVNSLIAAGAVILGKTTLSELGFHKSSGVPCGWSALAGQSNSAYVRGGIDLSDKSVVGHSSPGGSSSGSAIAVSAGLGVLAIGTETEGSLIVPSTRASLYTIKPSIGLISQDGIVPISRHMDTAGPMARSAVDLAHLLDALVDEGTTGKPAGGYTSALTPSWENIRVGVVNPKVWRLPEAVVKPVASATEQMLRDTQTAYDFIRKHAAEFHEYVDLRPYSDFEIDGGSVFPKIMDADFEEDFNSYLQTLDVSRVRTLEELRDYNEANSEVALRGLYGTGAIISHKLTNLKDYTNQDHILNGLNFDKQAEVQKWHDLAKTVGASLQNTLNKYSIDVIIGPGDSFLTNYAAANESPVGTLPMSYLELNGRPAGLQVLAPRHREDLIIAVQSAWEATWTSRQPPQEFLEHRHNINSIET